MSKDLTTEIGATWADSFGNDELVAWEMFDAWLNEVRAEAWDEGFGEGEVHVWEHQAKPDGGDPNCSHTNPYRRQS